VDHRGRRHGEVGRRTTRSSVTVRDAFTSALTYRTSRISLTSNLPVISSFAVNQFGEPLNVRPTLRPTNTAPPLVEATIRSAWAGWLRPLGHEPSDLLAGDPSLAATTRAVEAAAYDDQVTREEP
jgi:hypothetical protein